MIFFWKKQQTIVKYFHIFPFLFWKSTFGGRW